MSVEAVKAALRLHRTNATDKAVLVVIAEYAFPDGTRAYPLISTIAEESGADRKTVRASIARLEKAGILTPQTYGTKRGWAIEMTQPIDCRVGRSAPSKPKAVGSLAPSDGAPDPIEWGTSPRPSDPPIPTTDPANVVELRPKPKAPSRKAPGSPKGSPAAAKEPKDALARKVVDRWWEFYKHTHGKAPANNYMGVVKIVARFIDRGDEARDVYEALKAAPVPTVNAIELQLSRTANTVIDRETGQRIIVDTDPDDGIQRPSDPNHVPAPPPAWLIASLAQ